MRHAFFLFGGTLFVSASHGTPPDWRAMSEACALIRDDSELSICLRSGVEELKGQANAELKKTTDAQMENDKAAFRLIIRDTGSAITNFSKFSAGEKGASFNALRDKGNDSTQANAAVFAVFRPWGSYGQFQPFLGAAWARDGATTPKKDIRQLTVGTTGPIFESSGDGWQLFSIVQTVQLSHRSDLHSATDGTVVRAHFDFSFNPLSSGEFLGGLQLLPHVAGLWQKRTDESPERGQWNSVYAGLQANLPFKFREQNFKFSLTARKLFDTSVPDGSEKRRQHYVNLSLDYFFYNVDDKTLELQPSLFITRETGLDFLEYGTMLNRTTAGIRLKFN